LLLEGSYTYEMTAALRRVQELMHVNFERIAHITGRASVTAAMFLGVAISLAAQAPVGPIKPPPSTTAASQPAASATRAAAAPKHTSSAISTELPSIPVEQIIQQFAAREAEFARERGNFTYRQTFVIQTVSDDGRFDGEYRMTSDIVFTPQGKRYEKIIHAPQPTLQRITLSQQDFDDIRNVQPFVLTTAELPKYEVKYAGRQNVDELSTYVFDVAPRKIEKNQRYFQGRIWVDDRDLEIVKTFGKAVPDLKDNMFPRFETYRENIEGHYWFPTYTHADDNLHFKTGDVHIHMVVRYTDYKRYGSTIKLGQATPIDSEHPQPPL